MPEQYAQALAQLTHGADGAKLDTIVRSFMETIEKKGHKRLLPQIVKRRLCPFFSIVYINERPIVSSRRGTSASCRRSSAISSDIWQEALVPLLLDRLHK